jgi:hypothetical protein
MVCTKIDKRRWGQDRRGIGEKGWTGDREEKVKGKRNEQNEQNERDEWKRKKEQKIVYM